MRKTEDAIKDLKAMTAAGTSNEEMARYFGVAKRTVIRWRREEGIDSGWRAPEPTGPDHGTVAAGRSGCKCDPCRRALADFQAEFVASRQQETAANATREGEPWTTEEDATLLEVGPLQAARQLGRTYHATRARSALLRRSKRLVDAA